MGAFTILFCHPKPVIRPQVLCDTPPWRRHSWLVLTKNAPGRRRDLLQKMAIPRSEGPPGYPTKVSAPRSFHRPSRRTGRPLLPALSEAPGLCEILAPKVHTRTPLRKPASLPKMASVKKFAQFRGRKSAGAGAIATVDRRSIPGWQAVWPGAAPPGPSHCVRFYSTMKMHRNHNVSETKERSTFYSTMIGRGLRLLSDRQNLFSIALRRP